MINLPTTFLERMKTILSIEYDDFLKAITEAKPYRGLRINTRKINPNQFLKSFKTLLTKVPFDEDFYFIPQEWLLGNHPYFHAGGMYLQEPSAALPALAAEVKEDYKVLDLCAAPGGKSSQILRKLQSGFLIANEINYSRAKILASNIERLGYPNAVVTNNKPEDFLGDFEDYFDLVVVDAPCSGEGMFRKDEEAIRNWSLENVEHCASRQQDILKVASKLVKPNGYIIYSTCTFAPEENEEVIKGFLKDHPNFSLAKVSDDVLDNTSPALFNLEHVRRVWPHKNIGEGHFIALLERTEEVNNYYSKIASASKLADSVKKEIIQELKQVLDNTDEMKDKIYQINGNYHYLPFGFPSLKNLKVLLAGVKLGTFNTQRRFILDHQVSHAFSIDRYLRVLNFNLDDQEVSEYLAGYELQNQNKFVKEYVVVAVDNMALGFGKNVNGTIKNYYPKGLRNIVKKFEKY